MISKKAQKAIVKLVHTTHNPALVFDVLMASVNYIAARNRFGKELDSEEDALEEAVNLLYGHKNVAAIGDLL